MWYQLRIFRPYYLVVHFLVSHFLLPRARIGLLGLPPIGLLSECERVDTQGRIDTKDCFKRRSYWLNYLRRKSGKSLAVTSGGKVGECGRLSQRNWLLGAL